MKFINTRDVVKNFVPKYVKGKTLDIGGGTSKYKDIITPYTSEYLVSDLYPSGKTDFVEDARKLTHKDKTFDSILSFQLLEHVDDTMMIVKEMYRVLKDNGGIVLATVPFICPEHGHPSDFHRFTIEGIRWYFEQAGFKIIESGKQGSTFSVMAILFRFSFLSPYKKHGKIKTILFRKIFNTFLKFDEMGLLKDPNLYSNVYIVAQK